MAETGCLGDTVSSQLELVRRACWSNRVPPAPMTLYRRPRGLVCDQPRSTAREPTHTSFEEYHIWSRPQLDGQHTRGLQLHPHRGDESPLNGVPRGRECGHGVTMELATGSFLHVEQKGLARQVANDQVVWARAIREAFVPSCRSGYKLDGDAVVCVPASR